MIRKHRVASASLLIAVLLTVVGISRPGQAGIADGAMALVGPLAQQFGVPSSAISGLLEGGLSLESVTQMLLVSQSSGKGLDAVTSTFRESGDGIAKTAEKLDIDPADYSKEKVTASIDKATKKASADAKQKTTDTANDAVDSALVGLKR